MSFNRFTHTSYVHLPGKSRGRGDHPMYHLMNGGPKDLQRLLQMRQNCAFYCEILDHYAPAVVGLQTWNNDNTMHSYCTTNDPKMFAKHVLSVSDEAFIILVLVNSSPRWMAEIIRAENQVCHRNVYIIYSLLALLTHYYLQALNRWTEADEAAMPVRKYCK